MKYDEQTGLITLEAGEELRCIDGCDLTIVRSTEGQILSLCATSDVILMVDRAGQPEKELNP